MISVLVLSCAGDTETDLFEENLLKHALAYTRINREDKIDGLVFDIESQTLLMSLNLVPLEINLTTVDAVFWRGEAFSQRVTLTAESKVDNYLKSSYTKDWMVVVKAIEYVLALNTLFIGSPNHEREGNKIIDLLKAKECGFQVPKSVLCASDFNLKEFYGGKDVIFKHHGRQVQMLKTKMVLSSSNTRSLQKELCNRTVPSSYGLTFFQENLAKHLEAKVLYVCGELVPIGIFSQFNEGDCSLDYRIKMSEDFLRLGNIVLPENIERLIHEYVEGLGLNICVIDFIISDQGDFVFLEVNPTGRFNWLCKVANVNPYEIMIKRIKNEKNKKERAGEKRKDRNSGEQRREPDLSILRDSPVSTC